MSSFQAWPSISQFRQVVKNVKHHVAYVGKDADGNPIMDRTKPLPKLTFLGTVKNHGTNAAIRLNKDGTTEYQSRENDITPLKDNAAFAFHMDQIDFAPIRNMFEFDETLIIFGEWCGGSIQKGIALNQLPKMLIIFGIMIDGEWINNPQECSHIKMPEHGIHNIYDFPTFTIEVDMNDPTSIQNHIIALTEEVERECPVGKHFGVSGIGEGIVFTSTTPGYEGPEFRFKSKGEKHSASKVKKIGAVDTEKVNSIKEFVAMVVTENRLNQGLDYLRETQQEVSVENTGTFLRWLYNDCVKEEADVIAESGLEPKDVGSAISAEGRKWYFNKLNEQTFGGS